MKQHIQLVFGLLLAATLSASAQNQLFRKRLQRPESARPAIDLQAEPAAEPADELEVDEFLLRRNDLQGQVIELTFDRVHVFKQNQTGDYLATVTYESPRLAEGVTLLVPEEGRELFEDMEQRKSPQRESVYVEVINLRVLKALGTRFRDDNPVGERYSW